MTTACLLEWAGVSTKQVEPLIDLLDLEKKLKTGSAVFGAGEDGGKLIVITVWETEQALDNFLDTCLAQTVARADLPAPFIKRWEVNGDPATSLGGSKLEWKNQFVLDFRIESHKN